MKEVLGSLPEVITAYKNYNLLVPTATDVQLNPFYKFHVEEVPVDLGENSGDIFKVGSVKTGKQDERGKDIWEDVFSLSKPLLNKMAMAAGIQFNPKETYGERIDRVTYRAQAQGAMRKADGTARTETDQKVICLEDEEEKYRIEFADKATKGITDEKQAQAAAEIFSGQWVESKNKWGKKCQAFVVAKEDRDRYIDRSVMVNMALLKKTWAEKAMTGAKLRVIRALLGIKGTYTKAELQKNFAIPTVIFSPDFSDPQVRQAMLTQGMNSVAIMTADKKAYDITQFVEDVSWEEGENQLAARISFSAKNDKTSKGRISSLAKPGCYAALLYSYNGGKNAEATRGKIVEWNPSARTSGEKFKVKAYDVLYDLQESQDHVYFSAGVKTKSAIVQVLKRWGIKVTSYSGPNVKHGKLAYKSEKLGTVVVKILKEAKKKGGIEACLRAVKMNVTVVGFGTNKTVYHFEETQHLTEVNHKISTTGMVTRVKIIGKANDDGCSPVEATVDGKTSYGIRQKIVSRGTNDTLDEAKKEAREILADDGKPKEEITIKLPDIPIIRKGDKIHLKTASISAGYYIVISATHDVDKMLMTLGLKKAPAAKKSSGNKKTKAKSYDVGDIVNFHGGKHYVSSYPDARGYSVGAGKAKITIKGGSGKAHPWHLVTQNWNQTHVWGWVDDGSFD